MDEHNDGMKKQHFKVRDARKHGRFVIEDAVIDAKAREIGVTALAVYAVICRHVGQEQEAYPSQEMIGEKLGIGSRHTIIKAIKKLEDAGMLATTRERDERTKRQKVNIYTVLAREEWETTRVQKLHSEPGALSAQKPCAKTAQEGYTEEKDTHNAAGAESAAAPRKGQGPEDPIPDWEKYLEGMETAKRKNGTERRDLPIIAFYFREKKLRFRTFGQASTAIRRHLRAAKALEPFDDDQLAAGAKKAAREWKEWTLETVLKTLTR